MHISEVRKNPTVLQANRRHGAVMTFDESALIVAFHRWPWQASLKPPGCVSAWSSSRPWPCWPLVPSPATTPPPRHQHRDEPPSTAPESTNLMRRRSEPAGHPTGIAARGSVSGSRATIYRALHATEPTPTTPQTRETGVSAARGM